MRRIYLIFSSLALSFLCWFGLSIYRKPPSWIKEQIQVDLGQVPDHSIPISAMKQYFDELSEAGHQVLYGSIKDNQITWKESPRTDSWRNPHIFRYFNSLSQKKRLPDIAFILLTDDGSNAPMRYPVFSFSCSGKNNCPFPDFEMLWELADRQKNWRDICNSLSKQYPWQDKKVQAFFRGAATGSADLNIPPPFGNSRMQLMLFSHQFPDLIDAAFSAIFSPALQVAYEALGKTIESAPVERHFAYKWLLDVDGFANTYSRCRWILLSNSTLLKVESPVAQWYYRAMKPWIHYVPIKQDLSDLFVTLQYLKEHDAEANRIALNGQKLGQSLFSKKMVDTYVYELLSTYANKLYDQ